MANWLFCRNSMFPKRLCRVRGASSPLRHSLGRPQLAAIGTPPGEKRQFDKQNARIEHDKALERAVVELLSDHTELFKQFSDNPSFKKWLSETIFAATYADA